MMKRLAIDVVDLVGRPDTCAGASMDSSESLITRARRGDDEAFRFIFDRYARPVHGFVHGMLGDHQLAEELTQETFVRAHRSLKGLRNDAKLSTWLFGIAKNVAREALRSRRHDHLHCGLDEPSVANLRQKEPAPEGVLLDKELNAVIHSALSLLDEDKRMVFSLKVLQQQSYEEIAVITGFSLSKVKTDLHRARVEMRQRISPYLGVGNEV